MRRGAENHPFLPFPLLSTLKLLTSYQLTLMPFCSIPVSLWRRQVKPYQTSKALSSCIGAQQNFVKCQNCQILQFAGDNLTENVNQVNSISIFRVCKFNVIDTFGTYQMIILAFSSACAIIKFKIWWRQHLSAFLAQPNKASQPSVYDI